MRKDPKLWFGLVVRTDKLVVGRLLIEAHLSQITLRWNPSIYKNYGDFHIVVGIIIIIISIITFSDTCH